MLKKINAILLSGLALVTIVSCDNDDDNPRPQIMKSAFAISESNQLLKFDPENNADLQRMNISGLQGSENIVGIDFRPATRQLYAVGSNSRIYTIDTTSGVATFVATLSTALSGTSFAVDFNPVPDRIRIISNTGQNLRVNPTDGATIVDGTINPTPAAITAAGYTNSIAGATTTTLYVLDTDADKLYIQNPPNNGTLTMGVNLGVNAEGANGFDIGGTSGMGYAILTVNGNHSLYSINLTSGMATSVKSFGERVRGLALGGKF